MLEKVIVDKARFLDNPALIGQHECELLLQNLIDVGYPEHTQIVDGVEKSGIRDFFAKQYGFTPDERIWSEATTNEVTGKKTPGDCLEFVKTILDTGK